ncbi:MAG: gamma-glutamylcyclotransferase [Bdellovibrionaceae bacterium]|nr:gamma-glutamylcyclotransferase [Pseudobdellovibrionaceae bacterium]
MLDTLFVYGSFSEGMVHYSRLLPYLLDVRPAFVMGSVFRLPVGFPVYLQQGFYDIPGQVVRVTRPEVLLPLLDEFHGISVLTPDHGLFTRVETDVRLADTTERAWIYALLPHRLPKTAKPIEGGDWTRSLKENPPLPLRLTERQRTYIRKLGQCSGRDIVPIDLALYRELMHLDLVVDKGRRLALTPLGQDVHRFLE